MGQIVNVRCTRLRFDPGDHLLARVNSPLNQQQRRKMMQTLEQWVDTPGVKILILDSADIEIGLLDATGRPIPATPPDEISPDDPQ